MALFGFLSLYYFSVFSGLVTIFIALIVFLKYKKPVLILYLLFLFSLFLKVLRLVFLVHADIFGQLLSDNPSVSNILYFASDITSLSGIVLFIGVSPYFYHALFNQSLNTKHLLIYTLCTILALLAAVLFYYSKLKILYLFISTLRFLLILYGGIIILLNYKSIKDRKQQIVIKVLLILTACFYFFFLIDSLFLHFQIFLPLFYILLNLFGIYFAIFFLKKPQSDSDRSVPESFILKYQITKREKQVILFLSKGLSIKQISKKFLISDRTVENHVNNVYKKVGVNNRIQLFRKLQAGD